MKRMRKAASLAVVLALVLTLYGSRETAQMAKKSGKAEAKVSSVKITNAGKRLRLQKRKVFRLKTRVKVKPDSSRYKKLKFTSSDRRTVHVNSRGMLRGLRVGKAKVTAASRTNPGKKASIPVSVTRDVLVTGIVLNKTKITVDEFNEREIRLSVKKILPSNAKNKKVEWFTSNADIADVDEDGRMMTGNAGTATVTARAADEGGAFATCRVTVKESSEQGGDADVTGRPVRVTGKPPEVTMESPAGRPTGEPPAGMTESPAWQPTGGPPAGMTEEPTGTPQERESAAPPTGTPADETDKPDMPSEVTGKPTMSPGYTPDSGKLDMGAAYLDTSQAGMESMPDGAKKLLYTGEYQGIFLDLSDIDFTQYDAIKVTANVPAQISFTFYNKDLDTNEEDWWVTYKIMDFYPFWGGSYEDARVNGGKGEIPGIETQVVVFSHIPEERLREIVYLSIGSHEFQEGDYIIYDIEFVEKKQIEPAETPDAGPGSVIQTPAAAPTEHPGGYKNPDEAVALKQIIAEQRALGATVSEDLDSDEYIWDRNGNLVQIKWGGFWDEENKAEVGKNLSGDISFSPFSELERLECAYSHLSSLDVSGNQKLSFLACEYNQLDTLDVSGNPALNYLNFAVNSVSSLNVSGNPALTCLWCAGNQLGSLDMRGNPLLKDLSCGGNQLKSLDVSGNPVLTHLQCDENQLGSLDVGNNPLLDYLGCSQNQLESLDISGNPALKYLSCDSNRLGSLDVSGNPDLERLHCGNNELRSMDVSGNPDLTGLGCEGNQLSGLDVKRNVLLEELWCGRNELKSLDVGGNTSLTRLRCENNQLGSLDVKGNVLLEELYCGENQLKSLDIRANTALTALDCRTNQLAELDVSKNPVLTFLVCGENQLSSLDVSGNPGLTALYCGENQLKSLDVRGNSRLHTLYCDRNLLGSLDVSENTGLLYLECYGNQLSSLDISRNVLLKELICGDNLLDSLDVSGCPALTKLECDRRVTVTGYRQ